MKILHYFNPGHENAVLNRLPSYTPPASIMAISNELAALPAWYGDVEDLVLVNGDYDRAYYTHLKDLGLQLPKLVIAKELVKCKDLQAMLWGVAPREIRFLEDLRSKMSLDIQIPKWDDKLVHFNGRFYAKEVLSEIVESSDYFESIDPPKFFSSLDQLEDYVESYNKAILAKSPYSSSGRGLLWIPDTGINRPERQILQGMFNKQGSVSLEPIYDKVLDFAMEFMSDGKGQVKFVGYSLFSTTEKGVYTGNILQNQTKIAEKLQRYIGETVLELAKEKLEKIFSRDCSLIHQGCIGVDMMICTNGDSYVLHPCVEINLRYNMGYLSVMLFSKHIHPSTEGIYQVEFGKSGAVWQSHTEMKERYPLQVEEGKILSGYLALCPVDPQSTYRAYVLLK